MSNIDSAGVSHIHVSANSFDGMDLETAMLAVQSKRANMLESQLKDQIEVVKAKNTHMSKLNEVMSAFNTVLAKAPNGVTTATKVEGWEKGDVSFWAAVNVAKENNVPLPELVEKGHIDSFIQGLKTQIDSASNTQQMDMLRLQSLSNKRNEAFETMTNFMKKMQDNRNSIVGNMR